MGEAYVGNTRGSWGPAWASSVSKVAVLVAAVSMFGVCGCGVIGLFADECYCLEPPAPSEPLSPIRKALRYLDFTQVKVDRSAGNRMDYAGDWPQCFGFHREGPYVRDISPFAPAFVHHALSLVREDNRLALGVTDADVECAHAMRTRAIEFMLRFQAEDGAPDAGTFGFWPPAQLRWRPGDLLLALIFESRWRGPEFMGYRVPANVSFFPGDFAIPTDADVTAVVYAALLDHETIDGGVRAEVPFERFFSDWRDVGEVPQRNSQPWIGESSGAFLTWLAYRCAESEAKPNDVDILVNVNVLWALGRYGRLDTPGVSDAIALVNRAVTSGAHLSDPDKLSLYYPDNIALHYFVTRAFTEGGVTAFGPTVQVLIDNLLATRQTDEDGRTYWNRGDPHLNTAFAVLALLHAGISGDVVDSGIEYLVSQQDTDTGAWTGGVFFLGRLDDGTEPVWLSSALSTGMALEALCQYRMRGNNRGDFGRVTKTVVNAGLPSVD